MRLAPLPWAPEPSAELGHSIFSLEMFAGWELPNTYTDHKIISIRRPRNTSAGTRERLPASKINTAEAARAPNKGHRCAGAVHLLVVGGRDQVSGRLDKGRLSVRRPVLAVTGLSWSQL